MREQGGLKKLPRAERVNIIGGEAVENIGKTRERHTCFLCEREIPAGSRARSYTPVADGKLEVGYRRWRHSPEECPKLEGAEN